MKRSPASPDVDAYLAQASPTARRRLREIRSVVRATAPEAVEHIGYGIPAYKWCGVLVYFAAHAAHIGFYPLTAGMHAALGPAVAPYVGKGAKSTARFSLDQPIPRAFVARLVKMRMRENEARARARVGKRKPTPARRPKARSGPGR